MIDIRWGDVLFLLTFFIIPLLILLGCVLLWRSLTPQTGQHGVHTEGEGFGAVQELSSVSQEPPTATPAESQDQDDTTVLPASAMLTEAGAEEQSPEPSPNMESAASTTVAFPAVPAESPQPAASQPPANQNAMRLDAQAVRVRRRRRVRRSQPTPREHDQRTR
ncbi:hypothetical protein [Thermorudis peleae]|uniref:hypothetical protein n=1 Tax=Thermorudis peleae TaxID=1382356 RepID=UPI00056FEB1C|nr:hypothetical protein [Thermorudis peleae]MBX6754039.1 hypothetical protein [Thermorudis peleae]